MQLEHALEIFRRTGVMREGHFKLTSGRHSDRYMQCAQLFQYPAESEQICAEVAKAFGDKGITLVVGPAIGGIIMAYEVARLLKVRNIFAEREEGKMTLRRGFETQEGDRALVVEDVVTTGGSVKEVIELLHAGKIEIAGVGSVVDRSNGTVVFEAGGRRIPFYALATLNVESWDTSACPLCRQGLPIVKPGSRKEV